MNELQMQNIGGIDYHLKDQYARDIIATSENGLDSQSNLPVASRPYAIGEYLIDQNRLYYEVIDTISTGDVLVVGSNIKRTTVSAEINKLKGNSAIMAIEIVAPIEDTLLSAREYQADDPLYWVNEHLSGLYEATMHIVVGDALVIGTNIKPAKKVANSVKDINDEISDITGILGAKNLCPNNASTVTQSGVTYTVNTDGSVKITGTATAENNIVLGKAVLPKGTYKLTTGQTQEQVASQILVALKASDGTVIGRSSDSVGGALGQFTLNSDTEVLFRLACVNGRTGTITVYPMCKPISIEDDAYTPFTMTNKQLTDIVKQLTIAVSHVGMIIHSTTLNTEAKVKNIYGGNRWIQHSGYMLRGATTGVSANSATKTGGNDNAVVVEHAHSGVFSIRGSGIDNTGLQGGNIGTQHQILYANVNSGAIMATAFTGESGINKNIPNYKSVYIWERTE